MLDGQLAKPGVIQDYGGQAWKQMQADLQAIAAADGNILGDFPPMLHQRPVNPRGHFVIGEYGVEGEFFRHGDGDAIMGRIGCEGRVADQAFVHGQAASGQRLAVALLDFPGKKMIRRAADQQNPAAAGIEQVADGQPGCFPVFERKGAIGTFNGGISWVVQQDSAGNRFHQCLELSGHKAADNECGQGVRGPGVFQQGDELAVIAIAGADHAIVAVLRGLLFDGRNQAGVEDGHAPARGSGDELDFLACPVAEGRRPSAARRADIAKAFGDFEDFLAGGGFHGGAGP